MTFLENNRTEARPKFFMERCACKSTVNVCTCVWTEPSFFLIVDGGWSIWTSWSPCDKSCNGGVMTKRRHCTNPEPKDGGMDCDGSKERTKPCNMDICPSRYHLY